MGRIEADIALKSWLLGFQPYSGQGQFTLGTKWCIHCTQNVLHRLFGKRVLTFQPKLFLKSILSFLNTFLYVNDSPGRGKHKSA